MQQGSSSILKCAEKHCMQHWHRFTPNRCAMMEILTKSSSPISAYKILNAMRPNLSVITPPTAYGTLKPGLIHGLNSYIKGLAFNGASQPLLLIYQHCKEIQELHLFHILLALLSHHVNRIQFKSTHYMIEMQNFSLECVPEPC